MSVSLRADLTLIDGHLESGVVVHVGRDGRIEDIERRSRGEHKDPSVMTITQDVSSIPTDFSTSPRRGVHRLRNRILLPGFCNTHSHAFQRLMRGRTERRAPGRSGDDFWSWRSAMYRITQNLEPEELEVVSRFAFMEMLRAGYTHVTEFHYVHNQQGGQPYEDASELSQRVLEAADTAGIGITMLRVGYQRGGVGMAPSAGQRRFIDSSPEEYLRALEATEVHAAPDARRPVLVGMAAHSVRALDETWLRALASMSTEGDRLLHAHVSEQPLELSQCLEEHGKHPVQALADFGLLSDRFTAVHATHLVEGEAQLLGEAGAGVCICPTTERNLGDGLPALDALLDAGVELSVGSDSQARIDPFAELVALEYGERLRTGGRNCLVDAQGAVAPYLLQVGAQSGRRASGMAPGGIAIGERADLVSLDISGPAFAGVNSGADAEASLLAAVAFTGHSNQVKDVWVGGRQVVEEGTMLRWESTLEEYRRVAQRIWS